MAYIKGKIIQDIFSNPSNGYTVGLFRIADTDMEGYKNKVITFTGMFEEIKYKTNYLMQGNIVSHNKYGNQFQVESYEIVLPSDKEELVEFFSSDLFPIGDKMAERIVEKLGKDAISKIMDNEEVLYDIPRLSKDKARVIRDRILEYQETSQIVIDLNKMGFNTKDAISIMKKYNNKAMDIIDKNIYSLLNDIDISFDEVDKIARSNGYMLNDERRLLALTINMMNVLLLIMGILICIKKKCMII